MMKILLLNRRVNLVGYIKSMINRDVQSQVLKTCFALCFLLIILSSQVFSLPVLDSLYDNIKVQALQSLQDTFNRPIKIKSVSGRVIGQIVLHDVEIGNELFFKEFVINFNAIEYALNHGDINPTISKIELRGGSVLAQRDAKGFNLSNILKTSKNGGPPFKSNIVFRGLNVEYKDLVGMPYKGKPIEAKLFNVAGNANLRKSPQITFNLKGLGDEKSSVIVRGSADQAAGKYDLAITAKDVPVSKFGTYFAPSFDFASGKVSATVSIKPNDIKITVDGIADNIPVKVDGKVFNGLDVQIDFERAGLDRLQTLVPAVRSLDLKGLATGRINISGPYDKIEMSSNIKVQDGKLFAKDFNGSTNLAYKNGKFEFNDTNLNALKGTFSGSAEIDLAASKLPQFIIDGKYSNIDVPELTLHSPGIVGAVSGSINAKGSFSQFLLNATGSINSGSLWGQKINSFDGSLSYRDSLVVLNNLLLSSENSSFSGKGQMSKDREVSIEAKANGLRLKGTGILGPMQATIKNFSGNLSFAINDRFMKAPLKNLTANGTVEINNAFIGDQLIETGSGEISLDKGKIVVGGMIFKQGKTVLDISGVTGVSCDTDLILTANQANLSDLRILNRLLPDDSIKMNGSANIALRAQGHLDKLDSLEDLNKLSLSMNVSTNGLQIGNTYMKNGKLDAVLKDNYLSINNVYVKTYLSDFSGYLKRLSDNKIQTRLVGVVDLDDLKFMTSQYGAISGYGSVDFWAVGDASKPDASLTLDFLDPRFNSFYVDRIQGAVNLNQEVIKISKPVVVYKGANQIACRGELDLAPNFLDSSINASATIKKGEIADILQAGYDAYGEISHLLKPVLEGRAKVSSTKYSLVANDRNVSDYFSGWDQLMSELVKYKKDQQPAAFEKVFGQLSLNMQVSGSLSDPLYVINTKLANGRYGKYKFDKFEATTKVSNEALRVEKSELTKSDGKITGSGDISFSEKTINIKLEAVDMPLDIMQLVLDREYVGRFAGNAKIQGDLSNPSIGLSFKAPNAKIAGIGLDRIDGFLSYADHILYVRSLKVQDSDKQSIFYGQINTNGDLDLSATIEGETIGLVNLFTDEIKVLGGTSSGSIHVTKLGEDLSAYGDLAITNGIIHINKANADLSKCNLSINADNKLFTLKGITGYWFGERGVSSPFSAAGYLDLYNSQLVLKLSDGSYFLDAPGFYKGDISFNDLSFEGNLDSPTISGKVTLSDGLLYLPNISKSEGTSGQAATVKLNIDLSVPKNVYLTMGSINTINLSNILLNMEIFGEGLKISGTTTDPKMFGKIFFKRGTVNIFNREFLLLNETAQKEIYPYNSEKYSDNTAEFSGPLMPRLNVIAKADVEDSYANSQTANVSDNVTIPTTPIQRKTVTVVSHLIGTPQSDIKEKALNITFAAFEKDPGAASKYNVVNYSDDQIKFLLLPDFVKSTMGGNKQSAVDSNAVVADYLDSRLQTYLFRGLERGIEKSLGLESLTLEYSFGKDLRRALGAKDLSYGQSQSVGVSFVKGVFDKFFISVKYSQPMDQTLNQPNQTYMYYQLTYRLTPVLSISYYREPINLNDLISGTYKTTLQAGQSF